MLGTQNLRFLGGEYHSQFLPVFHDTDTVFGNYERRRVVMQGVQSRYEEVCMVERSLTEIEARIKLHSELRYGKKVTVPSIAKPLKLRFESSLIHGLAYGESTGALEVTFKDEKTGLPSSTYRYGGVPRSVLGDMLTSESLGGFYCDKIRNKYPCVKLDEPEQKPVEVKAAIAKRKPDQEPPKAQEPKPAPKPQVTFNKGDKVICLDDEYGMFVKAGREYVIERQHCEDMVVIVIDGHERYFFSRRFKLVEPKKEPKVPGVFKTGDKVVCVEGLGNILVKGREYVVEQVDSRGFVHVEGVGVGGWSSFRFKHAE